MERVWNTDVWIGLSHESTSGTFTWSDQTQLTWANWAVENPRGSWTGDHCVYMNLKRTTKDLMYWKVGDCKEEKLFICKKVISKLYGRFKFLFNRYVHIYMKTTLEIIYHETTVDRSQTKTDT
jgi:hypothetical protein